MADGAAKSVLSDDMQELNQGQENVSNAIQGHKANLSNPNTSEQSKENSRAAIEQLGGEAQHITSKDEPHSKNAAEKLEGSRAA